jgi:hypothetical protein
MRRVKIGPALLDREKLDVEIARLRDLDVGQLRSRWHAAFGRRAPAHLARHLLFRSLAYRLQADRALPSPASPFSSTLRHFENTPRAVLLRHELAS